MKNTKPEKIKALLESTSPKIRIYTFQNLDILKTFEKADIYYPKKKFMFKDKMDKEIFSRSYEWMRTQMGKRLVNYSGEFPLWGWIEQPGDKSIQKSYGKNQVKITALVDRSRVLLSDFEFFHCVLNDYYITNSYEEEALQDSGKFIPTQEQKEERWETIFDLTPPSEEVREFVWGQPYNGRDIQACIDGLLLSEIESIKVYD